MAEHHRNLIRLGGGAAEVARPLRDTSWWHRWRQERACRKAFGHCWHPGGFIDWWCCMCSAGTEGMPPQRCVHCLAELETFQAAFQEAMKRPQRVVVLPPSGAIPADVTQAAARIHTDIRRAIEVCYGDIGGEDDTAEDVEASERAIARDMATVLDWIAEQHGGDRG